MNQKPARVTYAANLQKYRRNMAAYPLRSGFMPEADTNEETLDLFMNSFQEKNDYSIDKLFDFINRAGEEFSLRGEEKTPFQWNVYRNRPQLRYTVASLIIQEIIGEKAETFHGKGTLACMRPVKIDFEDPDLNEGLRLFLDSLQMLALTIQPVLCHILETAAAGKYGSCWHGDIHSQSCGLKNSGIRPDGLRPVLFPIGCAQAGRSCFVPEKTI